MNTNNGKIQIYTCTISDEFDTIVRNILGDDNDGCV